MDGTPAPHFLPKRVYNEDSIFSRSGSSNMSQSVSISLYALRITRRRTSDPLPVATFDGTTDLYDLIYKFLIQHQGNSIDIKGGTRSVYITNDLNKSDRIIQGQVEVGNSGFTASIKDIQTGQENYQQKVTEAAMIPLHFRFWIPKDQLFGLTAMQHFGDAGCKTALSNIITQGFHDNFPDYTLSLRQVLPK